ncbi:hypothetical protein KFL_004130070 [Klebsormidium nitens]|uniref:Uncharacterized protein n=1 Tax=Klebsormidium nitens TaxID=105231 RepID=A0A1Y1IGS8_KLENI|nr:hypothetical protein KFL_004130070 [Klebsormidium nitens]|eukprot:GAQ88261.1 hypothetical protein KFL_004130070 [Klebsormidium nitens]
MTYWKGGLGPDMEDGTEDSPSSNAPTETGENFTKWLQTPEPYVNERSSSPTSTSYSPESGRPSRPSTARQEEVRWPSRNPHFRAISEMGFFASSIRRQARTAVPGSRLRVTTSAPSPEMEASMSRVASPVASFYVEGEYTAHLHVTTEEEELVRQIGAKRVEFSRLHVQLLERLQEMQDVAHVHRKMMLEQDWAEFERLQAERKAKQEELDGIELGQAEAWRNSTTLKMLLKRMVDLKREMQAMVALMRDSRAKTEGQIVETNVKLAEANRAKQLSLEELEELKAKQAEEREHRKKELDFLRLGIADIKESRMREVRRQEKQAQVLARMKNEESQRRMERLRRLKAAEEGLPLGAEGGMAKLEVLDEAALAERILEATGVSDPNLFLVKMLTRDQTHSTLELQKSRAHDSFERLNQTLQTLILHKRELQLEGVDEAYQKRSTGDIESRMIKSEARLTRAIRVYHQAVELIAPIRSGLDALCARIHPGSGREPERRNSMSINGSMLMGTWAETPKPVTDESRQLEDTLSKMDTIGDKLVKLMESVDPSSVAYLESNSRRRSARHSGSTTPRRSFRGSPKTRADSQSFTDLFAQWKQSDDKGRPTRKSDEAPRGGSDPTSRSPPRRSSEYADRPPVAQRRSSDFRDDRKKGHQRRASDFTTQSPSGEDGPKRRSADSVRKSSEASRSSDGERKFESLLSPEGEMGTARGVTETILEELVSEVSGLSEESDGNVERKVRISHRRRPQNAEEVMMSPAKGMRFAEEEVTSEDGEPKPMRSKTVLEPQVTIQEPGPPFNFEPGPPGKDAPAPEPSALESGVRRAMRRQMLQQNRAAGLGVGIDERGARKAILPGTRMHYPPPVEKVNMPRFNMRVATPEGVLGRRQSQWYRRSMQVNGAAAEEENAAADLEIARQRAEFKQELERLSAELSEEFSDGAPSRPRSHLRERLNGLLSDGDEDELGFKRDFASVDLVALREKFSKAAEPRKGKSHKAFLKRMMHKARMPDRRKAGTENKLLGQLEIPGLHSVLNNAVSPQPAARRKPLYEKKSELKGYSVITEKEQKRMIELLQDVRSKPKPRKAGRRTTSPEIARPAILKKL